MAGNLFIALREAGGCALSGQELGEYRVIVKAMYDYVAGRDGESVPVASIPIEILMGTTTRLKSLDRVSLDIETLLPDDLADLSEEPGAARRVAILAFFVTWVLLDRSKEDGFWSTARRPQSNVGG
ncbi:hypothetical protein Slin15195_G110070 [Septoria linicola]|uniref:Uncharacterized protein n=1 Tax=Septoria linicola TaxID=215465 RepID=A0A9Q9B563_9PEZI|nr:hypothetical protein Slin14017_G108420 [Septoria linicola]USW57688.1 hypothetical protein Slin15195_G110070 [Septoria linicola]